MSQFRPLNVDVVVNGETMRIDGQNLFNSMDSIDSYQIDIQKF
jgi:hypothetical protein